MLHRPMVFSLALAGTASTLTALWPSQVQLAELRLDAASTPEERLQALEARRTLTPDAPRILARLAEGYAQAGQTEAALKLLENEAARRALDREELNIGRRLALAAGQPERALALHMTPHVQIKTGELTSLVDLALTSGQFAVARQLQDRLVKAQSQDEAALARARDLALMGDDLQVAIAHQARLLGVNPQPATAFRLASLKLQAKDAKGALDTLEAHMPAFDATAWHHRSAQLAEWTEQPGRAVPHLRVLYAEKPGAAMGRRLLGALVASGDATVLAFTEQLAEAFPKDAILRREAAVRLVAAKRPHEALAVMKAAVMRHPADGVAHDALVDFALAQSLPDAAIIELARWVAVRPKDAVSQRRLAEVLGWQGRTEEAWAVYERLFAIGTLPPKLELPWRQAWLAITTPEQDSTRGGYANLQALVALDPHRLAYRSRLAAAHWALGNRATAIAEQRRLAALSDAPANDVVRLGNWLIASGMADEGLAVLQGTHAPASLGSAVLADSALGAAKGRDAGYFFGQLAGRELGNPQRWSELAAALESKGDMLGAAEAWRHRLALAGTSAADRSRYVYLLRRAARDQEALAYFKSQALEGLEPQALADGAALARTLGDSALEERVLRASLSKKAADVDTRLRLAELLEARGQGGEADAMAESALAIAPHHEDALYAATARRLYRGRADSAGPLVARLAQLPTPRPRVLSLLADFYETREPDRAAVALDALHRLTGGQAASWLRRGDVANRLGDAAGAALAWQRALELAEKDGDRPDQTAARAQALSALGRKAEALVAWRALADRSPDHTMAQLAIARHHLDLGQPGLAAPAVAQAWKLAPQDADVRRLYADWLEAEGRAGEALPLVAGLRQEQPSTQLTLREARLRHSLGELGRARALAQAATREDPGLLPSTRALRHDGASMPRAFVRTEHQGLLDRFEAGLSGDMRLDDASRVTFDLRRQTFGLTASEEMGAGARHRLGDMAFDGRIGLVTQDGALQSPLANVGAQWLGDSLTVGFEAAEARWTDTAQTVQLAGRERRVEAKVDWQPLEAVSLRAHGGVGRLSLGGEELGVSNGALGEAAVQPLSSLPLTLAYQFKHRTFGDAAARAGLPAGIDVHGLLLRYDAAFGPLSLTLTPGYSLDVASGAHAPTFNSTLVYSPHPDAELTLSLGLAGRSFDRGLADPYRLAEVGGHWFF